MSVSIENHFSSQSDLISKGLCHCRNCQKLTSSTYATNLIYSSSALKVSGEPKSFKLTGGSGSTAHVNFCGNCSSAMWTTVPARREMIVVKAGILDNGALERLAPRAEQFTSRKPSWVKSVDGAMQFEEGFKPQGQQGDAES